jgi:uncharacterized protein YutE (UPF0331/DUF86 family)
VIEELTKRQVFPKKIGRSLIVWVKTRNVIVHEYASIDSRKVYRALRRHRTALREGLRRLAVALGVGRHGAE